MNGCEECIEYRFHHNLIEPSLCNGCGNITMDIVQNADGYYHAECPVCHSWCVWSDYTPCGMDDELWYIRNNYTRIYIEPQNQKVNVDVIIALAKYFHINAVQMRMKLVVGELLEMKKEKMEELAAVLDKYKVIYTIPKLMDPREKYPYYKKCIYPLSHMLDYKDSEG